VYVRATIFASLVGLVLVGCGEEQARPWSEQDRGERMEYMQSVVLPTMRDIFQAYDPQRYAEFSCQTCHGEDASAVNFAMPNALFALPRDGTIAAAMAHDPEATAWMLDSVFPTMVSLLGEEKYNPQTAPDGYRCIGCHVEAPAS